MLYQIWDCNGPDKTKKGYKSMTYNLLIVFVVPITGLYLNPDPLMDQDFIAMLDLLAEINAA